jgi:hypothetical protein
MPAGDAAAAANSGVWAEVPSGTMATYGWIAGSACERLPKSDDPTPPTANGSTTGSPCASRCALKRSARVRLILRSAYASPSSNSTVAPTAAAAPRAAAYTRSLSSST